MGKMRERYVSLKWRFLLYFPVCVVVAVLGSYAIGFGTNDLQEWYVNSRPDERTYPGYKILKTQEGELVYLFAEDSRKDGWYFIISNAQVILIPLWVLGCVALTGIVFYNREMRKPIEALWEAAGKISDNELDFKVDYSRKNELGDLCQAFEEMRQALYDNNRKLWHTLEERKRLNSAFSHDLRTPLTVLRGYVDYLEKYIPEGKVSKEKLLSILDLMNGQVARLEHYTQKMNSMQKLEDILPDFTEISVSELEQGMHETGKLLGGEKTFALDLSADCDQCYMDPELFMQLYENLLANAFRYAKEQVRTVCRIQEDRLWLTVQDDGEGFSEVGLRTAGEPFFRDAKEPDKNHFGLGLYICRVICEKSGGELKLENGERGAKVTAVMDCQKKIEKSR